ncbi:MAG: tRNA 2-thiocytidine biosynthesis TtcA family protein [Crenarchaeota archaeon]|nr:tRNA 2-thiocytidine biosynthesis TtcA family protein [Thermoproteota archaeon]
MSSRVEEIIRRRVLTEVEKYPFFQRAVVALSGGKDSGSLLHAFIDTYPNKEVIPVHLNLGIKGFSEASECFAKMQAERAGLRLMVFNLKRELGFTIMDAERLYPKVCSVCGGFKRYLLNKIAFELGADIILTAHHLEDFLVRMLKSVLNAGFEELARFKTYLPRNGNLIAKGRPFCRVPESLIVEYAFLKGIPFLSEKCPIGRKENVERFRRTVEILARRQSQKLLYFSSLTKLAEMLQNSGAVTMPELTPCSSCGFLASSEICSFCARMKKIRAFLGRDQAP